MVELHEQTEYQVIHAGKQEIQFNGQTFAITFNNNDLSLTTAKEVSQEIQGIIYCDNINIIIEI